MRIAETSLLKVETQREARTPRAKQGLTVARAVQLAIVGLLPGGVAFGQALEEVVVTAERRETALQDTPISIVALSSETLERKGVEELSDVALFTPNLAINGSRGYGNNQPTFSIRGISGGGGATSERGVALYIDGIYVPRTNGSVFKVFDIERIEVLRGPQGTLFGRNSTGGAIRIVTKQPGQEFESYLRATLGNFERRDISGMVNIPVNERFSLRAQAAYLHEDGYVRRGTQDLGGSEDKLARLQAAFDVTDNVKFTLGGLYSESRSDGSPNVFETFDMAPGIIQGNFADWLSDALEQAGVHVFILFPEIAALLGGGSKLRLSRVGTKPSKQHPPPQWCVKGAHHRLAERGENAHDRRDGRRHCRRHDQTLGPDRNDLADENDEDAIPLFFVHLQRLPGQRMRRIVRIQPNPHEHHRRGHHLTQRAPDDRFPRLAVIPAAEHPLHEQLVRAIGEQAAPGTGDDRGPDGEVLQWTGAEVEEGKLAPRP